MLMCEDVEAPLLTHMDIVEAGLQILQEGAIRNTQPTLSLLINSFSNTLQRKSYLCIPFLGIMRPQSQFPHSCICQQFIYYQDWSTYFTTAE